MRFKLAFDISPSKPNHRKLISQILNKKKVIKMRNCRSPMANNGEFWEGGLFNEEANSNWECHMAF